MSWSIILHRGWEELYLKSIPIVQHSTETSHFKDLPILSTDDYSELTPAYLNEQYARILDTDYRIEKLYLSYWKRLIQNSINRWSPSHSEKATEPGYGAIDM